MIIIKLQGGLGNQMFQYAAGLSLALKNNTELKLDCSGFQSRKISYKVGRIIKKFALPFLKLGFKNRQFLTKWNYWMNYPRKFELTIFEDLMEEATLREIAECTVFKEVEPFFVFKPEFNDLPNNCYLDGFWQSEMYFAKVSEQIRQTFQFKIEPNEISNRIKSTNSVSLHFRRGDYVFDNQNNSSFGTLPISYYQNAIKAICTKIAKPIFYVFSDDENWVKEFVIPHFSEYEMIQIVHRNENYYDMYYMSLCKHNIMANSSFGWWGAWLNTNMEKIVIAPQTPFQFSSLDNNYYPESWILI